MEEDSKSLTAFTVGLLGFYQCEHMPFRLTNAPATFQHLMENCLGDLNLNWCIIYLDNIIVFSKTPKEHVEWFHGAFTRLASAGLKLKPSKCDFTVTDLIEQLSRSKNSEPSSVAGVDYSTPEISRPIYNQQIPNSQIQVKAELDIGKFSGSDPVPKDELTFEQWRSDIMAYQHQFPEYALLPVVCKLIQGKAKSVLRSLGPDFDIDQAIIALSREYEGVASYDVVFKQFYELCQEPKEKVCVFSKTLRSFN